MPDTSKNDKVVIADTLTRLFFFFGQFKEPLMLSVLIGLELVNKERFALGFY